uniref:Uncharacterized protein n=1 Tax=Cacopsylla melanoneura TaxID=428564 RepID=A0A8D8PLQ3_9HEMI
MPPCIKGTDHNYLFPSTFPSFHLFFCSFFQISTAIMDEIIDDQDIEDVLFDFDIPSGSEASDLDFEEEFDDGLHGQHHLRQSLGSQLLQPHPLLNQLLKCHPLSQLLQHHHLDLTLPLSQLLQHHPLNLTLPLGHLLQHYHLDLTLQ